MAADHHDGNVDHYDDDDDVEQVESLSYSVDSSFYGDTQTKADCEAEVAGFNPFDYWDVHQGNFKHIIAQQQCRRRASTPQTPTQAVVVKRESTSTEEQQSDWEIKNIKVESPKSIKSGGTKVDGGGGGGGGTTQPSYPVSAGKDKELFNPFRNDPMAYQLEESLDDFFSRLRPSTATTEDGGPWIWIANPHANHWPASADIASFKQEASSLLEAYMNEKRRHQEARSTTTTTTTPTSADQAALTRKLKPARDRLEAKILALAKAKRVTAGKWMLFVSPAMVDSVWQIVAKATLNGSLGCGAKVAVTAGNNSNNNNNNNNNNSDNDAKNNYAYGGGGGKPAKRSILICVYTKNYSDMTDVERVLLEMKNINLPVRGSDGRGIYYKCDAYSYLDIFSGNEFGLRASLYCSRDFEGGVRRRGR